MWTKRSGIGSTRTSQPSVCQPAGELARRGLLGAGLAGADDRASGLEDHHVAPLEGARR